MNKKQHPKSRGIIVDGIKYPSIYRAAKTLNLTPTNLALYLRQNRSFYGGYKIEYDNKE